MIMNPVIQGGGTLPEKVNIRYSGVVIHYMSESETGTFEIDNTTNAQSGTIEDLLALQYLSMEISKGVPA